MHSTCRTLSLTVLLTSFLPFGSVGASPAIEEIEIIGQKVLKEHLEGTTRRRLAEEGMSFAAAGGVSALPTLNGFGADRVKVLLDGAESGVSCANQMNPPLSYISANQIAELSVMAGITPVSVAGDNIGGVISVNTIEPRYTEHQAMQWQSGYLASEYRSVNHSRQLSAGARAANSDVSLAYTGAFEEAKSYEDGRGDRVLDTLYRSQNHSVVGAVRNERQQLAVKLSHQYIPFQGYPNQYMDMTDNRSNGLVAQYQRNLEDEGFFETQLNAQQVAHTMGFFTEEKPGTMPMRTEAEEISFKLRWRLPLADGHALLLGHEYHDYRLEDWWPAVEGSMMMGPNDYQNITDGRRQRIAGYSELRNQLSPAWTLLSGVRVEEVVTDVGEVQAYSSMPMMGMPNRDHQAAQAFNAQDRERSEINVDVTLLARYRWDSIQTLELGVARKRRSPNLYERYSWGRSTMAATMVGWFGEGNGYVGRTELKPETAHTFSASYTLGEEQSRGQLSVSPYYTQVDDYIDVEVMGSFNRTEQPAGERNMLQFTNVDATMYGLDIDARYSLLDSSAGRFGLEASADYRRGQRDDSDAPLYQIQPLRVRAAITHELALWESRLEFEWVNDKDRVDSNRRENATEHYALVNVLSAYEWESVTLTAGVDNLLNEYYEKPLGGVNIAAFKSDSNDGFRPISGEGRSVSVGLTYLF